MNPRLVLVLLTLSAATAAAEPDPRFSTVDPVTVGSPLGVAIGGTPAGFDVVARDVSNAPRPNIPVTLSFAGTGLRLYSTQAAGTTIDCVQGTLTRITDAQGHVNFAARFGGWNDANSVHVLIDGEDIASVKARSPDYDADGRVALSDLVMFSGDFVSNPTAQKSDFDLFGSTGLGDLVIFSGQFLGANQAQLLCP